MTTTIHDVWNDVYEYRYEYVTLETEAIADSEAVSGLLNKVDECDGSTAEKSLLRGYIAYQLPCDATRGIDIESEYEAVLAIEPTNTAAHLYLAYHHYDSRNFSEALKNLRQIDGDKYIAFGQRCEALKIEELVLAAMIHLSPNSVSPHDVIRFANELLAAGTEHTAVPLELVMALLENKSRVDQAWSVPVLRNVVTHLRKAIDETVSGNCLKEETGMIAR